MRKSVLVVDDEPVIRDLLRALLEDRYEVTTASDGHPALELLASRTWDLMITDVYMTALDGIELMQRASAKGILPPTIVITATPEDAKEAVDLGAIAILPKPFNTGDFQSLVASVLES